MKLLSEGRVDLESIVSVDGRPFGGGPGMVMRIEPLKAALDAARGAAPGKAPVIYLSPQGERLTQGLVEVASLLARKDSVQAFNRVVALSQAHPDDAKKLLTVGEAKADPTLDVSTLAAWTMLANQMMNLDEVLNK